MAVNTQLIDRLKARQRAAGETDATFAARIGISRSAWQQMRTGIIPPGRRALGLMMTAFPDLAPEVVACLLPQNDTILSDSDSKVSEGATA